MATYWDLMRGGEVISTVAIISQPSFWKVALAFLASQDALEVMGVTESLTHWVTHSLSHWVLVSRLYWYDSGELSERSFGVSPFIFIENVQILMLQDMNLSEFDLARFDYKNDLGPKMRIVFHVMYLLNPIQIWITNIVALHIIAAQLEIFQPSWHVTRCQ